MSISSKIKGSVFGRQVLLLAGGTALAQLINLAILPVLTRLYDPEDFGIFAVMAACAALAGVLVTMRYENAIIAVDEEASAKAGLYAVFLVSFIMVLIGISLLTIIFLSEQITASHFRIGMVALIFTLISAWTQALYFYCNRNSEYRKMTKGRVYGAVTLAAVSVGWGVAVDDYWGLLLGSISGALVNLFYLLAVNKDVSTLEAFSLRKDIFNFLVLNKRFPKYLVFSSFIDRVGSQGYLLLFTKVYGESVSGAMSLYSKVAGLPSVLIGTAIGDVFKRNASEQLRENGECRQLLIKTIASLLTISIVPFFILLFFGPYIFKLVFGEQWGMAGEFAQLLAPVFLLGFVISPISTLIYLEDNQKYDLILQLILIALLGVSLSIAMFYFDAYVAICAYAASYGVKYCIEASICWKIANGRIEKARC